MDLRFLILISALFILIVPLVACSSLNHESDHADHDHEKHNYTVDPSTTRDLSDPEVLREEALRDPQFVTNLTEEEMEFVRQIRPLHFDLKTMAMRVSGKAVLYFTGNTDLNGINEIIKEATTKYSQIENDLNEIEAPESMKPILTTYLNSVDLYQRSLSSYENYFETEEPQFLDTFRNVSNQANYQIKGVIFQMWTDEYNPH
jgi:hypothetical protein